MTPKSSLPSESFSPAPYGRACTACSRAKTKCYYRSEGSGCERCHRLAKACEPATTVRKRKARSFSPQPHLRLEEKLDDLMTLLQSQAVERQAQASLQTPQSTPNASNESSTIKAPVLHNESVSSTLADNPDVVIDTSTSVVHLYPASSHVARSPISNDVSIHQISNTLAEEQLDTFRRAFIPIFPFVHIPATLSALELRHQKPFLWLVIMSLSSKQVSQQFTMEETIWHVISQRIVVEHFASLDLLLGVICFASWSHYFKREKPFMTMLSQLAVSLVLELGLHNDAPKNMPGQKKSGRVLAQQIPGPQSRNMEERRSILAVFHLMSSTWTAYRTTEPLRWTPYMEECLRTLEEGEETDMDIILVTQVKCYITGNMMTSPSADETRQKLNSNAPSQVLVAVLLQQLTDIQQQLPPRIQSHRITRFYLQSTKLRVQDSALNGSTINDQTGISHFRRVQELSSILTTVECWLAVMYDMPLEDWVGMNVDIFAQFTHLLVVLFKLTTLQEPGWDLEEVKRRADLFDILDRSCGMLQGLPLAVGITDADGPRRGLFFKSTDLLKSIKALFLAEMPSSIHPTLPSHDNAGEYSSADDLGGDFSISDDFMLNLANEPWLFDIFDYSYALGLETS